MHKRIVLKMSGEALSGNSADSFDQATVADIIRQIKTVRKNGAQVSMIVGGGNIWRGRDNCLSTKRCMADQIGMLATVMNALYLQDAFEQAGIGAAVMTPFTVSGMTERFSVQAANHHLENGHVLFFAGGTGLPFVSTDTIAPIRAAELAADLILYAKAIDGVYDANPKEDTNAKKLDTIACRDLIKRDLNVIDLAAAQLCLEQKKAFLVFALNEMDAIVRAVAGEQIGTLVTV